MNFNKFLSLALLIVSAPLVAGKQRPSADLSIIKELPNVISNSFDNSRLELTQIIPPDPINAVGPKSIVSMVNSVLAFHKKDTLEELFKIGTTDFWAELGTGLRGADVYCVYDEFAGRFVLEGFRPFTSEGVQLSAFFFAISKDDNPQTPDDFFKYLYIAPDFSDYPKVAVDKEAIYMSTTDFDGATDDVIGNTVVAFDKAPLYDGSAAQEIFPAYRQVFESDPDNGSSQLLFPCQPRPVTCGTGVEQVLFARARTTPGDLFSGDTITVYQIKDVLSNPTPVSVDVSVPEFFGSTEATVPQPAPIVQPLNTPLLGLEVFHGVIFSGAIAGNSMVIAQNAFSTDGQNRTVARFYEIDVTHFLEQNTASLVQAGAADPGGTTNQIWPSINADKDGNIALQFTLVGEEQYPAIAYTGRFKSDPLGTIRLPLEVPIGGDLYYQIDFGSGRNRYGDYSGLVVDPTDHKTFWLFNEYPGAEFPGYDTNTFVTAEGVGTFDAAVATNSPAFTFVSGPGRLAEPLGACEPLTNDPDLTGQIGIAQFVFGDCGSGTIVTNVEAANAKATLILDDLTPTIPFAGLPGGKNPVVSISAVDGQTLLEAIEQSEEPIQISITNEVTAFPIDFGSNWTTYLGSFQIKKTKANLNAPQQCNLLSDEKLAAARAVYAAQQANAKKTESKRSQLHPIVEAR